MILIKDVYELCLLIVTIILALFGICVLVLILWHFIYLLYRRLFSRPKSKIASAYGRQYELFKDMLDLIDNEIQITKCQEDNQKKERIQLKGELLRITNLLDICSDINNMSDEEKSWVLNKLFIQLKSFYNRMNESNSDKVIYSNHAEEINRLCSEIKNTLNNSSKSWLSNLLQNIKKIFCSKHDNPQIEEITKGLNEYITKIEKKVEKVNQPKDNGKAQQ